MSGTPTVEDAESLASDEDAPVALTGDEVQLVATAKGEGYEIMLVFTHGEAGIDFWGSHWLIDENGERHPNIERQVDLLLSGPVATGLAIWLLQTSTRECLVGRRREAAGPRELDYSRLPWARLAEDGPDEGDAA